MYDTIMDGVSLLRRENIPLHGLRMGQPCRNGKALVTVTFLHFLYLVLGRCFRLDKFIAQRARVIQTLPTNFDTQ